MMKIVLVVVALLLLGGGGGGYWYFFMQEDPDAAEIEEPPPPPVFVEFNPIQIPVLGPENVEETYVVSLALEAPSDIEAAQVVLYSPRLNDAFLQVLYGVVQKEKRQNGTLDMRLVKARVLRASNDVLGEGIVSDVLVQAIGQRSRTPYIPGDTSRQ